MKKKTSAHKGRTRHNFHKENQHYRDISSKVVLKNKQLCAQFLRDNVDLPILKNISPDDLEDVTERFLYAGSEFLGDSVQRVRINRTKNNSREELPVYILALIEHKSSVDFNVSMQLLKCMVGLWSNYAKEREQRFGENSKNKDFRYPPIIPIVYYEGKAAWTADLRLCNRIFLKEMFQEYIPDFSYKLVRNHDYSVTELLARKDEMSLIMLLNQAQTAEDLLELGQINGKDINKILRDTPEPVLRIIAEVAYGLCVSLKVPEAETRGLIAKVEERDMGYFFENLKKDVENTERAMKAAEKRAATAERKIEQEKQRAIITTCRDLGSTKETAARQLTLKCNLTQEEATLKVEEYWQE